MLNAKRMWASFGERYWCKGSKLSVRTIAKAWQSIAFQVILSSTANVTVCFALLRHVLHRFLTVSLLKWETGTPPIHCSPPDFSAKTSPRVLRRRSRASLRHRVLHVSRSCHVRSHAFRQVKGRTQTMHILDGKCALATALPSALRIRHGIITLWC